MRDLKVREVDIGCIACDGERTAKNASTAFVAGVLTGLVRDDLPFCPGHYQGFRRAMDAVVASESSSPGTEDK